MCVLSFIFVSLTISILYVLLIVTICICIAERGDKERRETSENIERRGREREKIKR